MAVKNYYSLAQRFTSIGFASFIVFFSFVMLIPFHGKSQNESLNESEMSAVQGIQYDSSYVNQKLRKRDQKITVFGYNRLFLYGRDMIKPYPGLNPYERTYSVGDGYREPMLSMTVLARPNVKEILEFELEVFIGII
jgi:hypothetical protein